MTMQIDIRQFNALADALQNALSRDQLYRVIQDLGEQPGNIGSAHVEDFVFFGKAVSFFNRRAHIDDLINRARVVAPDNPALFAFAQNVGLASRLPAGAPDAAALEAVMRSRNPYLNLNTLVRTLTTWERQICTVRAGTQTGTGFLVGRVAVMTNYHVVREAFDNVQTAATMRFTFDAGRVVERPAADWYIAHSENDPRDGKEQAYPIDVPPDRLDFAVIRLARPPGEQPDAGAAEPRGRVAFDDLPHDYDHSPGMLIAQYPGNEPNRPLLLAMDPDAYTARNAGGTRIYYHANTDKGSSGSPCFDMELRPIALHQGYVPGPDKTALINQGVPLDLIYRSLVDGGALAIIEQGA